jgi:hypothetical protein
VAQLGPAQRVKAQRMAQLSELVSRDPELTPAQAARELGVSLSSGKRYLSEIRTN